MESSKKNNIKKRESKNYRLVIQEEKTYKEKFKLKLSRTNVFLTGTFISLIIVSITTSIIFFTPVREYIPGYDTTKMRVQAIKNLERLDSLINQLSINESYLEAVSQTINGEDYKNIYTNESQRISVDLSELDMSLRVEDSILRKVVEREDKFNVIESETQTLSLEMSPPVRGIIIESFDVSIKHYGIDIVLKEQTPVKAVADGIVLLSEWTIDSGHTVIVYHKDQLTSIYKHNYLSKVKTGDYVKQGQVVALSGNTGELTSGPHLHFELWDSSGPINPEDLLLIAYD
jgi:murein DD-endopeptidase MepM/ murein hydrolase activator NlpD